MRIGVFDSGIGGQAVAEKLRELLPEADVISVDDHEHIPYGTKPADEIISLTDAALQPLFDASCDVIVIACNTATAVAIDTLRQRYPDQLFIGFEPMVKTAANLTKSGRIGVLATPTTLKSDRYKSLKDTWAADLEVLEPDCSDWTTKIENHDAASVNVEQTVKVLIDQHVDVIVLGCTHYHWLKDRIAEAAGKDVAILEPTAAIAKRIKSLVV